MISILDGYSTARDLIEWALAVHDITKPVEELTDDEIRRIVRWLGMSAVDSILVEGEPIPGRIGIGLMLSITLLEFPEYYVKYELAQFN
jgi:hypothetical protein